ncbi:HlyD family secretion protein [Desulfolucanica intricata]|uniref:HlyD family secretion protein n=1 Tax=Desulfolucanica intricata TaxID=1285191 RepID=UPI00082A6D63|nr:efflux RND transporter periplasmic adaptor subunit [Desulfolucanica intricata]
MSTDVFAKINSKKTITSALLLGLIVISIFIFGSYARRQTALSEEQNLLITTGTIEAKSVMASFKIPGKIDTIAVDEGSKVKEAQKLATLETDELKAKLNQARGAFRAAQSQARQAGDAVPLTSRQVEAAIEQARAKVAQAEVGVTNARQLYDRMAALHQEQAVSDNEFDKVKNNYELAQQQLLEAQAALDQALAARLKVPVSQAQYEAALGQSTQAQGAVQEAQVYLENAQLKAPIAGYITQKFLEQGEMVNAGTPVFEITDLEHTYIKVFIDEKKIGRVKLNQIAEIRVPAYPGKVFKGKVIWCNNAGDFAVKKAVNEQYDHDIRSFEVKIDIPNPDLALKVGMTAKVKLLEEVK